MHTGLDCLPCFMDQALRGARLAAPGDEALQRSILDEWGGMLRGLDLAAPPVLIARRLFDLLEERTGMADPFAEDKERANARVMEILPRLERMVANSGDPLLTALELSIVGNYIDVGVRDSFDWEAELSGVGRSLDTNAVEAFRSRLQPGAQVLILGDNAGEIGIDRLLAGVLADMGCRVAYAVRSGPVLNDATLEDAARVGLDRVCEVLDSGCNAPGAVPERLSEAFRARMHAADVIVSKGQGNYESLEGRWPGVFFAFKVKCDLVSRMTGVDKGASLFLEQRG